MGLWYINPYFSISRLLVVNTQKTLCGNLGVVYYCVSQVLSLIYIYIPHGFVYSPWCTKKKKTSKWTFVPPNMVFIVLDPSKTTGIWRSLRLSYMFHIPILVCIYLVGGFNPSEKYDSQLGLLFRIYMGKYCIFTYIVQRKIPVPSLRRAKPGETSNDHRLNHRGFDDAWRSNRGSPDPPVVGGTGSACLKWAWDKPIGNQNRIAKLLSGWLSK